MFKVIQVNGAMITAAKDNKLVTRNCSFFKKLSSDNQEKYGRVKQSEKKRMWEYMGKR
jgi:hypothetical protein